VTELLAIGTSAKIAQVVESQLSSYNYIFPMAPGVCCMFTCLVLSDICLGHETYVTFEALSKYSDYSGDP
jgi:hypothetical protein